MFRITECRSIIFLCLLLSLGFSQESQRCSSSLTVDISNASKLSDNVFELDNVIYNQSNYIENDGKRLGCICNIKKCIRKCSTTANFSFDVYREKEKIYHINLNNFTIVFGYDCPKDFFGITLSPGTGIFMQENGSLYYENVKEKWIHLYDLDSYCVDLFDDNFSAMVCVKEDSEMQRRVNGIGMLISMPFLFITLLVYTILPERNLHRRALICYVSCTIAANITLVRINFDRGSITPKEHCQLVGFLIIYFYLVSFFWLNVMCIDMWLAFSSSTGFLSKKTAERKKFIMYSIYAWGVPFCFVAMVLIINIHCDPESYFHPRVGYEVCFLQDGWPMFYFFYLPIAILITVNMLLFSVTALKIFILKKETQVLKRTDSKIHSYENDKQNFNLYLKLMFAMGVNWITEIISWGVKWKTGDAHEAIFYLPDFINAMYGLLIFLIFVFKKKIWRDLQKRYYGCIKKPELAPMTSTRFASTRTRTSNCSTDSFNSATTECEYFVNASPRVSEQIP